MRPRSSAAITPSIIDSTSAADSACSRRSSSNRSAELPVHLPERLDQRVDVGNARAGEAGRRARGDGARRRRDLGERPGDRASGDAARARSPTSRASSAAPATAPLRPAHDVVHLVQVRRHPDHARPARHRDVEQLAAHRLAPPGRRAPARPSSAARTSGRPAWFSIAGSGPGGKVAVGSDPAGRGRPG